VFAIAFDLVVADALEHHPRGVTPAYDDIGRTLLGFGFNGGQRLHQREVKTSRICYRR
jgi:virulence-associated protein VapD